jgi:S1-C subfamily serine protease
VIDSGIYRKVRNGVCAVGFITEPLDVYRRHIESEIFQVTGTGFLVSAGIVLTNRHVIGAILDEEITRLVPKSQFFVQFVAPGARNKLELVPRMIREVSYLDDPKLDIGIIKYKTVNARHFRSIRPLTVAEKWTLQVSEEVGVCGYPYGTQMLARGIFFRWGPVLQQGHISAVSPFDTTGVPDEMLLDVRTAGGMSGAPIFRPTGQVIGIHYAGIEATTAFGIPLIRSSVEAALLRFDDRRIVLNPL